MSGSGSGSGRGLRRGRGGTAARPSSPPQARSRSPPSGTGSTAPPAGERGVSLLPEFTHETRELILTQSGGSVQKRVSHICLQDFIGSTCQQKGTCSSLSSPAIGHRYPIIMVATHVGFGDKRMEMQIFNKKNWRGHRIRSDGDLLEAHWRSP